jgi:hypothetical protein
MSTKLTRRRPSRRGALLMIALIALCAWGGLLTFTYFVPPQGQVAPLVFLLLGLALWSTSTLPIYAISWLILARRGYRPTLSQAVREGGLISAWLIFNLLLKTLSSWSILGAVVSFGIIVVIELLVLGRA